MKKQLDLMNIEELGNLFPVIISEPDPAWIKMYAAEKINIEDVLGVQNIVRVEHIGSTAVPNLKAKPTIDILLEVPESIDTKFVIEKLISIDYHYIHRPENPAPHMMFVKGIPPMDSKDRLIIFTCAIPETGMNSISAII